MWVSLGFALSAGRTIRYSRVIVRFDRYSRINFVRVLALGSTAALVACGPRAARMSPETASDHSETTPINANTGAHDRHAGEVATVARVECSDHPETVYPSSLFTCGTNADCVTVEHGMDRCGGILFAGVNVASRAAFDTIEARCRNEINFGTAACAAAQAVQTGNSAVPRDRLLVNCVAGTCVTTER
jgi:hypothetical protein